MTALQFSAIGLAFAGLFLSSVTHESLKKHSLASVAGLPDALLAACFWGVGVFLWKLVSLSVSSASLPVFLDFFATFVLLVLASVFLKKKLRFPPVNLAFAVFAAAFLNAVGAIALLWAFSVELASLVAPIAAVFPVVSVVLAFVFFKERLALSQFAGVCLVIAGIVLASI